MAMMDVLAEASFAASQQETEAVSILQGLFAARESPEPEDACGGDSADEADGDESPRPGLAMRMNSSASWLSKQALSQAAAAQLRSRRCRRWTCARGERLPSTLRAAPRCSAPPFRKTLSPDNVKVGGSAHLHHWFQTQRHAETQRHATRSAHLLAYACVRACVRACACVRVATHPLL